MSSKALHDVEDQGLSQLLLLRDVIDEMSTSHTDPVLRITKPGHFKDMLISKDEMTISELKSFLRSHMEEKSTTELFQELIKAKQQDHETPQQFLYRMVGLKQNCTECIHAHSLSGPK